MAIKREAPFPVSDRLTAILLMRKNPTGIAGQLAPITPLPSSEYRWSRYDLDENFTLPKTLVGRSSRPWEVNTEVTEESGHTKDYGLDYFVPQRDLDRQSESYDPLGHGTEYLGNLMDLHWEK
ncbi:MAG: phage capsid protein, partial [Cyanobacteria bacterium P01_D01_bin.73]